MISKNHAHEVDVEGDFADEFDSPSENHRMAAHHFSEAAKEHGDQVSCYTTVEQLLIQLFYFCQPLLLSHLVTTTSFV
jgi:hypothetical protein